MVRHSLAALLMARVNLPLLTSIPSDPDVKEYICRILSLNCVFSSSVGSLYLLIVCRRKVLALLSLILTRAMGNDGRSWEIGIGFLAQEIGHI